MWYDWGGLNRKAADDGRRLRRDPEPRRPATRQGARHHDALDGDFDGRSSDHSRHILAFW